MSSQAVLSELLFLVLQSRDKKILIFAFQRAKERIFFHVCVGFSAAVKDTGMKF